MTFTPKIPPRGPDPPFAIPTTVLEPVLFLVYWGERKRDRSLQRTASHQDFAKPHEPAGPGHQSR